MEEKRREEKIRERKRIKKRIGQDRTGQDRTGQDRTGHVYKMIKSSNSSEGLKKFEVEEGEIRSYRINYCCIISYHIISYEFNIILYHVISHEVPYSIVQYSIF